MVAPLLGRRLVVVATEDCRLYDRQGDGKRKPGWAVYRHADIGRQGGGQCRVLSE